MSQVIHAISMLMHYYFLGYKEKIYEKLSFCQKERKKKVVMKYLNELYRTHLSNFFICEKSWIFFQIYTVISKMLKKVFRNIRWHFSHIKIFFLYFHRTSQNPWPRMFKDYFNQKIFKVYFSNYPFYIYIYKRKSIIELGVSNL